MKIFGGVADIYRDCKRDGLPGGWCSDLSSEAKEIEIEMRRPNLSA
jgi:hypothetical protein